MFEHSLHQTLSFSWEPQGNFHNVFFIVPPCPAYALWCQLARYNFFVIVCTQACAAHIHFMALTCTARSSMPLPCTVRFCRKVRKRCTATLALYGSLSESVQRLTEEDPWESYRCRVSSPPSKALCFQKRYASGLDVQNSSKGVMPPNSGDT